MSFPGQEPREHLARPRNRRVPPALAGGAGGDPVTAIAGALFGAVILALLVVAGIGWLTVWSVKKVANAAKHKTN